MSHLCHPEAPAEGSISIDNRSLLSEFIFMRKFYVYIITIKKNGTLYTGVTSDINARMQQHKDKLVEGFTKKYDLTSLVFAEECDYVMDAIAAEKIIKGKSRQWKINLIETMNPLWKDLSYE